MLCGGISPALGNQAFALAAQGVFGPLARQLQANGCLGIVRAKTEGDATCNI